MVEFEIPIEIVSETNQRGNWRKHWPRKKAQRGLARVLTQRNERVLGGWPWKISLIRIKGKRQRDFDDDNLRSAFKAVRDGIADALGIDDGSDRLEWVYRQEKGASERGFVIVTIEEKGK